MIRIIRTDTLRTLRTATDEAVASAGEAERWRGLYQAESVKAEAADQRAEKLLRELAQAHADRFQAERERNTACAELATTRKEFEETGTRVRGLLEELRTAAHDPDTGTDFQARLALELMRRTLAADIERGNDDAFTVTLSRLLAAPEVGK